MADQSIKSAQDAAVASGTPADVEAELVTESLVEEVSIDGMCGVY